MLKIKLLSVGKTKELWLDQALEEYVKRLQGTISFEFIWVKSDEQLVAAAQQESGLICFDAQGVQYTSEEFASFFYKKMEISGSRLCLVIGGPEGLPQLLKSQAHLVSFSKMTFTHQIARLVLLEQIYRATEIVKGTKYHK